MAEAAQEPGRNVEAEAHPSAPDGEQRVTLTGVSWALYEALSATRGDSSAVRMTYCEGVLELMTPGKPHESHKTRLGRLIEAYADEKRIDLMGVGSWTLKSEEAGRGAEADESYIIGSERAEALEVPDFAVEVVVSRGSVEKLEVYKGFGVPEVWFYEAGRLTLWTLDNGEYAETRSRCLPGLEPALIVRCMAAPTQLAAVDELRATLRGR